MTKREEMATVTRSPARSWQTRVLDREPLRGETPDGPMDEVEQLVGRYGWGMVLDRLADCASELEGMHWAELPQNGLVSWQDVETYRAVARQLRLLSRKVGRAFGSGSAI